MPVVTATGEAWLCRVVPLRGRHSQSREGEVAIVSHSFGNGDDDCANADEEDGSSV